MTEVRWENLGPRAMEQRMNEYPVVTTSVVPQSGKRKTIEIVTTKAQPSPNYLESPAHAS